MTSRLASKVLLVGWDAADWKLLNPLLEAGEMPALEGLIDRGVLGNVATLTPIVSPMLWTSIATGKRADKHGILGFVEPDPNERSIRPVSSTSRRCKALWNILSQQGLRTHVVGWFASHPAEPINGVCVSNLYQHASAEYGKPWPLPLGAIHPQSMAETLAALRLHPGDLIGPHLASFVPDWRKVDQEKDPHLSALAKVLAENITIHAAATHLLEHEPWDFLAVYYDGIDHFGHGFMRYHPPRLEGVPEEAFELYKGVMNAAYRFHDQMLARLLQLAGPDATVLLVSDHGFHSDHLRPRNPGLYQPDSNILWHRPQGILCLAGPGIKKDELLHGASLLDVAPTVLALFGLPDGDDMDGRPLLAAFERPLTPERIPSWDEVAGECGMHPAERREDPWQAQEAINQLVDLGYVEASGDDLQKALRQARAYQTFNLARVHLDAGHPAEAAPLLEELTRAQPEEITYVLFLARCRLAQGRLDECRRLIDAVVVEGKHQPFADLLRGNLCYAEGKAEEALTYLLRAESVHRRLPDLHCQIGRAYLRLKRWADAERAYRTALECDADCARAHLGVARSCLEQNRLEEAADAALNAVGLQHHFAEAHCVLGVALARLGRVRRAIQALETSLAMQPRLALAHHWLAAIHEQATGQREQAAEHRRRAEELAAPA